MKNIVYILLVLISLEGIAQSFADKEYYLIDSLVLESLSESDKSVVESSLKLYHTAKDDTSRLSAIERIVEDCWDDNVWPKYNSWIYLSVKEKLNSDNTSVETRSLKKFLAEALNSAGYYSYYVKNDFDQALINYLESLKIFEEINDKTKAATLLTNLGMLYSGIGDVSTSLSYHELSLKISEDIDDKKGVASSLNEIGVIYNNQGNMSMAIEYYSKSLEMKEQLGDKLEVAVSLNNIGYSFMSQGDIPKALEYFHEALKIDKELGKKESVAITLNNIGFIYKNQGDYENALKYYKESLKSLESIKDEKGIAGLLNNIGMVYQSQDSVHIAKEYYNKSLFIYQDLGNNYGIATVFNNLGNILFKQSKNSSIDKQTKEILLFEANEYFEKSMKIRSAIGDKNGVSGSLSNIGNVYLNLNKMKKAHIYAKRSLLIAKELGIPESIKVAASLLSNIYERQNKGMKALEMHKLYITMSDSINNQKTQKASAQQQAKYEYEKQKTIDDTEHEKQKAIDDAEHDKLLAVEQEEREKQQVLTIATAGGLALVIVFLLFVFNRLKITKRQKLVIEDQKQEVEEQKDIVEEAHHELAEKNQEILDSINYAKRIQNAILPPSKLVKEYLQESFILYKPKDIVAGDFYWMEHVPKVIVSKTKQSAHMEQIASDSSNLRNDGSIELSRNIVLFAAADCTGHGVPGAMVSVVCNNALNRSVREYGLTEPGPILDKTREIVIQEFEKSEEDVKDGMDIALCSLEFVSSSFKQEEQGTHFDSAQYDGGQGTVAKLQYAGAHNPLWIIRPVTSSVRNAMENVSRSEQELTDSRYEQSSTRTDSQYEIIETKANKQPIGKFDNQTPYTTHTFELEKGDTFYIFSDGYIDQFGGEKGKKFKAKAFRELLLSIQDKSMEEQRILIDESFEKWRGDLEQIDDICIIGVKI